MNSEKTNPWPMVLPALGVVYGDIGTSPLYAVREAFSGHHGFPVTPENIYGVLSLITWSLIIVVSLKYLLWVLYADNKGEGGVLALTSLAVSLKKQKKTLGNATLLFMGLFGSALLFGDGAITPAITVISAIEGLKVVTPIFEPYVVPITTVIIVMLFVAQKFGTAKIGLVFGPIILLWFTTLGILGVKGILLFPEIIAAANPYYAFHFFVTNHWEGLFVLGAVFLVVTGGEALYADMGHFGRKPIQIGWFLFVLPGLLLNYYGQGALLLTDPNTIENPFYKLAPDWAIYPLVLLATFAAIIASQALISGVFSLTRQAMQLGYLPRIKIVHTSQEEIGQIYIPQVNWLLLILTLVLVFEFKTSSNLAATYGIAVALTMVITTVLAARVSYRRWKWGAGRIAGLVIGFLIIDIVYFAANSTKFMDGGWVPITIGFSVMAIMTTWRKGRKILMQRLAEQSVPFEEFIKKVCSKMPHRVPGVAIFMTGDPNGTPPGLLHNLKHNKVLHERIFLVTVLTEEVPTVSFDKRVEYTDLGNGFYRITAHYGFMETPDMQQVIRVCNTNGLKVEFSEVTFFLGRETIIPSSRPGMAIWREHLFSFLTKNSERATRFFNIPPDQVVEIGIQIEM